MTGSHRLMMSGLMAVAVLVLLSRPAFSQNYVFGPNVRVNDDPPGRNQHSTLTGSQRMLAARGDTVYAVWKDDRTGAYFHVYFARSTDGGRSFQPNIRLDNSTEAEGPTIALDTGGGIHVCWRGLWYSDGSRILYSKSSDGGVSFSTPVRVSDTTPDAMCADPIVGVSRDGMRVYILGTIVLLSDTEKLWLARSTDGGQSFIQPSTLVCDDSTAWLVDYSFVIWKDTVVLCSWGAYLARSFDGGRSFGPPIHSIAGGYQTVMAIDSFGRVYAVSYGPYLEMSDNLGDSFAPGRQISPDGGDQPAVCVLLDGRVFVTYYFWNGLDGRYHEVRMVCSTDRGETFLPPVNPSDGPDADEEMGAAVTANEEGIVFVAWDDNRNDTAGNMNDVYLAAGSPTAIAETPGRAPATMVYLSATSIATGNVRLDYCVPGPTQVRLGVYDQNGGLVKRLTEHITLAGRHRASWDGTDTRSRAVRSGVYFVRLETLEGSICRKVVLMKE